MSLRFTATLAQRGFSADIRVGDGEHIAVLGHNGSGKSTLLNILAGTLRPDEGVATLDGTTLFSLGPRGGVARAAGSLPSRPGRQWLPPHTRGISLLAQDAMLFPHLSVIDNVAFGPRVSGLSRQKSRERAESWLERVGALEFVARRPNQLSGGQAQRVALARALAAEPRLLLLDEPMAALDIAVAPLLRRVLAKVLAGRTTMIVTHDLLDALLLSDRIVVLQEGKVVEDGPTDEVLTHPRTSFTARIAGLNLVRGRFRDGCVVDDGLAYKGFPKENEDLPDEEARAAAVFPPSAVSIHTAQPEGSPRNTVRVTVAELEPHGELVRVRGDDGRGHVLSSDVTGQSVAELDLYPGREVVYAIKAAAVTVFAL